MQKNYLLLYIYPIYSYLTQGYNRLMEIKRDYTVINKFKDTQQGKLIESFLTMKY